MTIRSVATMAMALVLAGCACTAVGCDNRVEFLLGFDVQVDVTYDAEICFDGRCETARLTFDGPDEQTAAFEGPLSLWADTDRLELHLGDGDFGGSHRMTLALRDDAGAMLAEYDDNVELARSQPNGAFCEPTCWSTEIDL